MSEHARQVGSVALQNLELLRRACEAVYVEHLGTTLKLDMTQKKARYWQGRQAVCDGAITFGRELTEQEKSCNYEISLTFNPNAPGKPAEISADGTILKPEVIAGDRYELGTDTHASDRYVGERVKRIFQAYRVEELKQLGTDNLGASVSDQEVAGQPGWRLVTMEIPD